MTGSVSDDMDQEPEQTDEAVEEQPTEERPVLPGFSVMGEYIEIDGERTMVFEYSDEGAAEEDQNKVSGDGMNIDGNDVSWDGPVHFFRHGTVIVVYVGENEGILEKLRTDAGDQFAGQ